MFTFQDTFIFTRTFRQFIYSIFRNIVSSTLSFMARFTKVCGSPTKPLRNRAAKFAFKFDKFFTVFRAIVYRNIATICTNKLFRFKFFISIFHILLTILMTSKIRLFTFKTQIICVNCYSVFNWLLIKI